MTGRKWWLGTVVVVLLAAAAGCTPPPSSAVVALGGGAEFNCALYADGQVWCWGADEVGQLGRGAPGASSDTPAVVGGLSNVSRITAGIGDHECAVVTGGRLLCWGSNDSQQLGTMFYTSSAKPLAVAGLPPVTSVAAGRHHTCAVVTSTGGVKCWGSNTFGELGNGTTTPSASPVDVVGLTGAVQVTAGDGFSCALKTDFTVWCWGEGNDGQLGNGVRGAGVQSTTPVEVLDAPPGSGPFGGDPLTGITDISAGLTHVCAVQGWPSTSGGSAVWCWGTNESGELGTGTNDPSSIAVPAAGLVQSATEGVRSVQSGWYHTCAELVSKAPTATSSVICWGATPGNGAGASSNADQSVPPLTGLSSVGGFSAGFDHTCALVTPGSSAAGVPRGSVHVYCWGRNGDFELGSMGPTTPTPQPVLSLPLLL